MAPADAMVRLSVLVAVSVGLLASATVNPIGLLVTVAVGVPDSTPVAVSDRPAGRVPLETLQE